MSRMQELLQKAAAEAKSAREIAEKADAAGREMSEDERADFEKHFAAATQAKADADVAKKDADLYGQAKALADEVGLALPTDEETAGIVAGDAGRKAPNRVPLEKQVVNSPEFKALLASFPDGRIPEKSRVQSQPIGLKSLFVGGTDTSAGAFVVAEQTGIVEMLGRRTLTLRDVISVRRTGSDTVEYVAQTSHTNAAAPVAEATSSASPTAPGTAGALVLPTGGGYKPEGAWAFERRTATVKTIAEWVPATKRALADVAALEGLIRDELVADLKETEETQMFTGSGSGENLTGILETSGTQTQAFSTDIFQTVRKAITKARTVGRVIPNAVALAPADVEKVDLMREDGATGKYFGNGPFSMGPRTLWGLPIVETEALTAGTGLVGDFKKAVLWDREQASVTMTDSHADFFIRNLVAILAEERVAFAVTRPSAFVETATA
ncbi:phage major capsid protein [Isoptericola sp. NPDC056134]|uniref:phage major capsid protein n=1 Tax=Isoptericola sp. NPDC056134 TaxID=3345723 RepID=UPI0035E7029D